jgi:hypothetical protein
MKRSMYICISFVGVLLVLWALNLQFIREEEDQHLPVRTATSLRLLVPTCKEYLRKNPNPEKMKNSIAYLPIYEVENIKFTSCVAKSGKYAFYITKDAAWVGFLLPKLWLTRNNNSRRAAMEKQSQSWRLYGSASINFPPLSSDKNHSYKQQNNAVWMKVE